MKIMEAPPCPTDYSVPKWANLLFGGNNCQVVWFFLVSLDDLLTRLYARVVGREESLAWILACVVVCVSDVPKTSTCYLSLFY